MNTTKLQRSFTLCALLLASITLIAGINASYAGGNHKLGQRIGYKSQAVVKNDLRVMGFNATSVKLSGNTAKVKIKIGGKFADVEVNRRTGALSVVKASPNVLKLIKQRAPLVRLKNTNRVVLPPKRRPLQPIRRIQPKQP